MAYTVPAPALIAITRGVDALLETLQLELDSAKNPHRIALRSLGLEPDGWTATVYSDEAFRIWDEHLRRNPDDPETLHHLAIMHHARAIDLEASSRPQRADADWQRALDYWGRLWTLDAFWERITAVACKGTKPDAVHVLRGELPQRLLRIHFDLAFDEETRRERPHRSAYHMDLVRRLPFPAEHLESVQRQVYLEYARLIPEALWRSADPDPTVIAEGERLIREFLDLVPDCLHALEDAVRLEERMLNAWYTDVQAAGDEDRESRWRLLDGFRARGAQWRGHFDRLAQRASAADPPARHGLCHWYRLMAQIHDALDLTTEAETLYELGLLAAEEGDDERVRCVRGLGELRASYAEGRAENGNRDARDCCERARATPGLSRKAQYSLAHAWFLLDDSDRSEAICKDALARPMEPADWDDLDDYHALGTKLESLLENIQGRRGLIARLGQPALGLREEAARQSVRENFEGCAQLLQEAVKVVLPAGRAMITAELALAFADWAEHVITVAIGEAEINPPQRLRAATEGLQRLQEAVRLDPANPLLATRLAEAGTGIESLADAARHYEERMADFGGEDAFELHQQATDEWNADRPHEALALMRRAREVSRRVTGAQAAPRVTRDLSAMLAGIAIRRVNEIRDTHGEPIGVGRARTAVLREAETLLNEAIDLDGANTHARDNLERVQMLQKADRGY